MPIYFTMGAPTVWWVQLMTALTPAVSVIGALLVVYFSNRAASKNQVAKLEHDSSEADIARQHELKLAEAERAHAEKEAERARTHAVRKELATRTTEAMIVLAGYVGQLPMHLKQIDGVPFQTFFSSAAQLQLVVEASTAAKIEALCAGYAKLQLKLFEKMMPLMRAHSALDWWIATRDGAGNSPEKASAPSEVRFRQKELLEAQLGLLKWILSERSVLIPLRTDAISAIRQDLYGDADISEMAAVFETAQKELDPLFEKLFEAARANAQLP